jgi:EF-hand domain-containing family member B
MRTREQIKSLFEAIGHSYKLGKFNAIYNRAKDICQSTDDKVSVRAMMQACQMLHHVE